ncbi:4-(cytidine 5'-diphospho)-2-C-methyl-D-erythritol kinase [Aliisedimentitalea scapharcae]|uniref:4-diphosphocytidyl-2-C-methyl-D-erythritol kinase n=1 Tax=Aliisedimentitalea scapharcae TaxID=1524259 RepID=A0ABZ2XUY3_9RHOB
MTTVEVFAPAKINLTLHVTDQRADGYHLLDSLVVFADIGDTILAKASETLSLALDGPQGDQLTAEPDNLVLRAARLLAGNRGAALTLVKRLPVASGIGGGSADAAATLHALSQLWGLAIPESDAIVTLGADVPVCMESVPQRMTGIGDTLAPVPGLPRMDIVLVNPGVSVSTPSVFQNLSNKRNAPMPDPLPHWRGPVDFVDWLQTQRNDLLAPAITLQPVMQDTLQALRQTGAMHVGMSGSGATCFALFPKDGSAQLAAQSMPAPWWRAHGQIL